MEKLNITIQPRHPTFKAATRAIYVDGYVVGYLATANPFNPGQPDFSDQVAEILMAGSTAQQPPTGD